MSVIFRKLALLAIFLFASACSTTKNLPGQTEVLPQQQRQQQLAALHNFTVQAAVGIKSPAESVSGNLRWQQQDASAYQARLANMLGISLFELTANAELTELLVRGERYQAADASNLLWQLAGWSIPLHDMALWLRGLPGDSATELQYDTAGRLVSFNLTDSTGIRWQLTYRSFFDDALSLPKQLQLQSADTQVRLVIRSWQL
ncbi:outer membrane lipoprotein LolB [Alishewanella agri BL06]|uniref:Outer-membrane lipoprotein LolB n=1 Tax=Alishewanella agri BL06 TaxID=1195246 RepID=I8U7H9_9ALTE|nr:lipoprotein insertase outer membrane protein LolB [Alishewanella agri]EIW89246.1 outer membrane lipoprotein LolB [Alishewanella agri BL06]